MFGIEIWLRDADRPCQRLMLLEHAVLQHGERDARVAGGMRDGRELFRVTETFGSQLHPGDAIEDRLEPCMQLWLRRR